MFEAVGLADEIVDRCFTGTTSRLRGTDFSSLYMDICRLHQKAYPPNTANLPLLDNQGQYHYRDGGEAHLNNPETIVYLQVSVILPFLLGWARECLFSGALVRVGASSLPGCNPAGFLSFCSFRRVLLC